MERPYVHVNCASTLDGRIAYPDGSRMRISNEEDMRRVHHLRRDLGSIMVGARTILMDDPKLTVKKKFVSGFNPLNKIVIDGRGTISPGSRFMRTEGRSVIVSSTNCDREWLSTMEGTIEEEELECEILKIESEGSKIPMDLVMETLKRNGIEKILVEGGTSIISQLIASDLFDRFTIFYGAMIIGGNGPSLFRTDGNTKEPFGLEITSVEGLNDGLLLELESRQDISRTL